MYSLQIAQLIASVFRYILAVKCLDTFELFFFSYDLTICDMLDELVGISFVDTYTQIKWRSRH